MRCASSSRPTTWPSAGSAATSSSGPPLPDRPPPPREPPEPLAYRLAFGDVNQIRAAVAGAVPGVRVAVDPRTNSLLITGTAAQHQEVVRVLGTLDVRIAQGVVQLHALQLS